jgi:DNA-binding GntR family transcriptional regulator
MLRERIFAGVYPAGAALRQDALAADLGVSRIPVREALVQLEAEGLVRIAPHKGASVVALDPDEVLELYALRALVEPELMALSTPLLREEDFAALDGLLDAFDARAGDPLAWGELNTALHLALYARAPRPRTLALASGWLRECDRTTRLQLGLGAAGLERARREHRALVDLARAGDAAGAARLTRDHILTVRDEVACILNQRAKADDDARGAL